MAAEVQVAHRQEDLRIDWDLFWSDEFDGPVGSPPNPMNWQSEIGGTGWGDAQLQYYTNSTENASLDGRGNLIVTVARADRALKRSVYGGCDYTSARLVTKDRFAVTYGILEARIKLPGGRGIWPAFWMLGRNIDDVGWPQCGEIDVMESFGKDQAVVQGTVHGPGCSGRSGIGASHNYGTSLAEEVHTYAIKWQPDAIQWYVDHRLFSTITPSDLHGFPWVFDHDFYLLLNVAVGGTFSVPPDTATLFPRRMFVDYIRIYRR